MNSLSLQICSLIFQWSTDVTTPCQHFIRKILQVTKSIYSFYSAKRLLVSSQERLVGSSSRRTLLRAPTQGSQVVIHLLGAVKYAPTHQMLNVSLTEVWENGDKNIMEIWIWILDHEAQAHHQVNPRSSVFLKCLPCNNLSTQPVPDLANGSRMTSANLNTLSRNLEMIHKIPAWPYTTTLKPGRAGRRHDARCPACRTRKVLVASRSQPKLDQNSLIVVVIFL